MSKFRFIFTTDHFDRAADFYGRIIGLPTVVAFDDNGRGVIFEVNESAQIEIFEGSEPSDRPPQIRMAWEVSDVDSLIDRLSGVSISEPPADRPWGHRNATILDPDGLQITFFQIL